MGTIANRYMIVQPLKQMTNGLIVRGKDLISRRDVLIYTVPESDESANEETLRWMKKASQISNENVMPIMDVGSEEGTLFAALQAESGYLLSDKLNNLEMTGHQALAYVHELSKAIRETQRNQLFECSVDADNLWIEENGQLLIMNSWAKGNNGRRGVPGLALLLYQLGAKTDVPTSSMSAYSFEMSLLFADLVEGTRERAVGLACKAYEGLCTLEDFQRELEALLGIVGERREPLLEAYVDPPKTRGKKAAYKWPMIATAGFGVLVVLLFLSLRPHSEYTNDAIQQAISTPDTAAASTGRIESTKTPASASSVPAPTAAPTAKPTDAAKPTGDGAVQDKLVLVPDLTAHTREDAERMALEAGLRYQFYLESNGADEGTVFKQDIASGTAIPSGDRITFWVSKGP